MLSKNSFHYFSQSINARILKEEGWKYYIWPSVYGVLFIFIFLLLSKNYDVLTGFSEKSLNDTNKILFGNSLGLHEVFLLVHGGFVLAMLSSLASFNSTVSVLKGEFESGAFEIYLSANFSVSQIICGYLFSVFKLVARQYIILMLIAILPCYLILGFENLNSVYLMVDVVFPLISAIYVSSMVCFLCFYNPRFLDSAMGFKGNFLRFVALAPATFTLIAITTLQPDMFIKIFWVSLILIVLFILLALFFLKKAFDIFSVITSY